MRVLLARPPALVKRLFPVGLGAGPGLGRPMAAGSAASKAAARALVAERYSVEGVNELKVGEWESAPGGFNTTILDTVNPSYAMPLPVLCRLESRGVFKKLYPYFCTTVGNQMAVGAAREIGQKVAREPKATGVDGAIRVAG